MFYFDPIFLFVLCCSLTACTLLILTKHYHMRARADDTSAVQASHAVPTPRIGGVAIGIGMLLAIGFLPAALQSTYVLLLLSAVPVFVAGLAEDLGYGMSPAHRLIAAAASSLLAIILLGAWVGRSDVPGFDWLLGFLPVAILFTMFATAGVSNAFNLIDGLNGLSASAGVVTSAGLAVIAYKSGQSELALMAFVIISALLGFLLLNFPWGKIFLGDAGAYSLGHVMAWISVLLMFNVPDVSPWAVVLVFFWPLADTFFAIYRRRRSGRPTGQPDRLHYNQLVMRFLEIRFLGRGRRHVANPLATLVMIPFIVLPVGFGVFLWDKTLSAFIAVVSFGGLFIGSYLMGVRLARSRQSQSATFFLRRPAPRVDITA